MKHLRIFEDFNSNFDPYQEVSQDEFDNWISNHKPEPFKKSDTLIILEIIDSLWNRKSLDIDFFNHNLKIDTPVRKLFRNDQIWDAEDSIFTIEQFNRIEVYDHHHYFQIEKWEDEWYTAFYDTYGGGEPHYFIVDTDQGIDWLQDKMSSIYSDVYESGEIDESKEVVMMGTLTNDDNELIEDIILEFVEKWNLPNSKFKENGWTLERFDRFQLWLNFSISEDILCHDLKSDMDKMVTRIEKFGYNVTKHSIWNSIRNKKYQVITLTISHKVEESISEAKDPVLESYKLIIEDVSDLFVTELNDWSFTEYGTNDDYNLHNEMYEHPEKDFVFRVRTASWLSHLGPGVDHSICVDIVYNTELWAHSSGKCANRLIHDFFKFSKKCCQRFGLIIGPKSKDMTDFQTFITTNHYHTNGEIRLYFKFKDEPIKESNLPEKIEATDGEFAIEKWSKFKENHIRCSFTNSQKEQIIKLIDLRKCNYKFGINSDGNESLILTHMKWVDHSIPQWKSGYNKIRIDIDPYKDEWFLISVVNYKYGYTDIYIADQFDQLINFIKSENLN